MNKILWKSLEEAHDYFARLGGSGCYSGYKDWHAPCLVLMVWLETVIPSILVMRIKTEQFLPDQLWTKTDGLANKIARNLLDQKISRYMASEFIEQVTNVVKKHPDSQEMIGWTDFVESINPLIIEVNK